MLAEKAQEIRDDYLIEGSQFRIELRKDILQQTLNKVEAMEGAVQEDSRVSGPNQLLFIELLSYVLERLKVHFEKFKRSTKFVELEEEISRQEKLYEILADASIITS